MLDKCTLLLLFCTWKKQKKKMKKREKNIEKGDILSVSSQINVSDMHVCA